MSDGIAYQNKDIEFKILSEGFKDKSFRAYGLELPKIKAVLPTNLPRITADEKRIDNLFLLEDDTLAIVDYEAENKKANQIKYINYIARVLEKYEKEKLEIKDLRMIVIYTGDVIKATPTLEMSCFSLRIEQVFLTQLKGDVIYQRIKEKIENQIILSEEELMQLIILPLTDKGSEKKQERIQQVVELAKRLEIEEQQLFVITGVLVNTNQFIDRKYASQVRRWLSMNKVFQIFEEEKQAAVEKARQEAKKEAEKKAKQEAEKAKQEAEKAKQEAEKKAEIEKREMVERMLHLHMDETQISMVTGYTKEQIKEIEHKITILN